MKQNKLFPETTRPRRKPRKLMHVIDAGPDETLADCCMARFRCVHCNEETDWMEVTITEAKRGIPCPKCN